MARSFGWPTSWVFGAFSVALLAGGLAAPYAGRLIDRRGAAGIMAWGTVAASVALVVTAVAPIPAVFVAGLVATQIAGTFALYDAAFAHLVQLGPHEARTRITHLTLIAGFSSTLFWPITNTLHEAWTWREVLLAYAAVNLVICLPAHLMLARVSGPGVTDEEAATTTAPATSIAPLLTGQQASFAFVLVTGGFALGGFVLSAVLAQLVPVIEDLGITEHAVACAALFGPAQVAIRFITAMIRRAGNLTLTLLALGFLAVSMLLPLASGASLVGAALFAILFGFASGLYSIVRGTLPLTLFGSYGYAARMGRMSAFRLVLTAFAPFVFAKLVEFTSTTHALAAMALVAIAAFGAFIWVARLIATPADKGP
jgi:MFS family permease